MYLQITTKCNMKCAHCGFSCTNRGKHMPFDIVPDALDFIRKYEDEFMTIGGGEPTLHPDFFKILKRCLTYDFSVWMATNGSQTQAMERLAHIIDDNDFQYLLDYSGKDPDDNYMFYDQHCINNPNDKVSVALSRDSYHDSIDQYVVDLWTRRANNGGWDSNSNFSIRTVQSYQIKGTGRAKKNGLGATDGCLCDDYIIKPDGKVKLCGCEDAPVIGDIWNGFTSEYEDIMYNDDFNDLRCYKALKRGKAA